ncbi:sulfur carrier protein ThiS [Lichenicola sp.]|uniref:sulfur carrier protein ThiS n=1 Tax=Lichenicola sp. TaxID=2804529 RepID=UPI003AFFD203
MEILVNGERHEVAAHTLDAALSELGYGTAHVATAVDGDFVPASARAGWPLADGSAVEIVAPMRGG